MEFRALLEQVNQLLVTSKIEEQFISEAVERNSQYHKNPKNRTNCNYQYQTTAI
jgi:hypothetical protein